VSCCQGGDPVSMCSSVAAKPQMSTLLVGRAPGANCSGALLVVCAWRAGAGVGQVQRPQSGRGRGCRVCSRAQAAG
jgi:hypothetical protein